MSMGKAGLIGQVIGQREAVVGRGVVLRVPVPAVVDVVYSPFVQALQGGVGIFPSVRGHQFFQHPVQLHVARFLGVERLRVHQCLNLIQAHGVPSGAGAHRQRRQAQEHRQ